MFRILGDLTLKGVMTCAIGAVLTSINSTPQFLKSRIVSTFRVENDVYLESVIGTCDTRNDWNIPAMAEV